MTPLEKKRAAQVIKAEARAGIKEGHYRLIENGSAKMVSVTVSFYPKENWWVEDTTTRGEPIIETRRALTEEIKAKLESWL